MQRLQRRVSSNIGETNPSKGKTRALSIAKVDPVTHHPMAEVAAVPTPPGRSSCAAYQVADCRSAVDVV